VARANSQHCHGFHQVGQKVSNPVRQSSVQLPKSYREIKMGWRRTSVFFSSEIQVVCVTRSSLCLTSILPALTHSLHLFSICTHPAVHELSHKPYRKASKAEVNTSLPALWSLNS
jgi:hypothetical protein